MTSPCQLAVQLAPLIPAYYWLIRQRPLFTSYSLHVLSSNVVIGLDSNGVYAMSAICTHAGCVLDDNAQTIAAGLSCPCHGSTFDGNGKVTDAA